MISNYLKNEDANLFIYPVLYVILYTLFRFGLDYAILYDDNHYLPSLFHSSYNYITGNVQPYQFVLPPTWKQARVANILSGNYCQPKCAEPWVEVKFEDEKQGKVQVVASPLIRLTNKPNATIEDIGSPEKLIASLGPFVTGNSYDPDELLQTSVEKHGNQTVITDFQLKLLKHFHFHLPLSLSNICG